MTPDHDNDPARARAERRALLLTRLGWLVALPLLLVALLRVFAHDRSMALIMLNAFSQWLYLPAWLVLGAAVFARRWRLAAVALLLVGAHIVWVDPRGLSAEPLPELSAASARVRVMSVNLLGSNGDTEGIAAEVLRAGPDVLLLQEVAPHWQERFDREDLRRALPHRKVIARTDNFGIGIYSRATQVAEELTIADIPAFRADVAVAGGSLRVYNFHTMPPRAPAAVELWNQMMASIVRLAESERGPVLLGGDLNATPHHAWFQRLLSVGLRSAHEERGRALATTWPNSGLFPAPPIRLDHLLVSKHLHVLDVTEGEGRGSDHRPVIGDFALAP